MDPVAAPRRRRLVAAVEAKAHFAAWLREAEAGTSVVITRHGRPAAVLVPADLAEAIDRLRSAGPDAGLASLAGGWQGSDALADGLIRRSRRRRRRPRAH